MLNVHSWLWPTERPIKPFALLRTLLFGFIAEKVRAERERGYEQLNVQFATTKGLVAFHDHVANGDDAHTQAIARAFEHIGEARCFTLNKGSISYNHNMAETYREGIGLAG